MPNETEEDWAVLLSLFPEGWENQARKTGAMARHRGIAIPETLLRLFLLHVARGYSLRETSVRATESGLATISDVGILKRLRRSEDWLHWLCAQLVSENGVQMPQTKDRGVVRIVDGTIIKEPGKTGSQWRILYSIRLPDLRCDYFNLTAITGVGTGESFARLPIARHDLILGDAGYSTAAGIAWVVSQGGDVLVRVNPQALPLQEKNGSSFDLLSHLQTLKPAGATGEWRVRLKDTTIEGRICALRKSEEAIQQAHRRIERKASRKQTKTKPGTWEYAKYVVVFTTDLSTLTETIMEWYRVRWQIELTFKRLKSLAKLGHLPKYDAQSSRAWLYGKLFVALLTQKLVRIGREISPWGYVLARHAPTQ
ncbi:MAG TPA: IS4 family transposase [Terriglobales bacterium]